MLGSCVSQQVLAAVERPHARLVASFARLSLAGLTARPDAYAVCDAEILSRLDLGDTVRRWLSADLAKTALPTLVAARPDYLFVDLIEERFDLIETASGVVLTESADFVASGLADLPEFRDARRIPRLSEEAWRLWEAGLQQFRRTLQADLPDCRVVFIRGGWATDAQSATERFPLPERLDIMPGLTVSAADYRALHRRHVARFLEVFPDAICCDEPADTLVADPDHRWGLSPFHNRPEYYDGIAEQLVRLDGVMTPIGVSKRALIRAARQIVAGESQDGQSDIHPEWQRYLAAIAAGILEQGPESFTGLPIIAQTMFIGDYDDTARQLNMLRDRPDWTTRWEPALVESAMGNPGLSGLHPPSSGNQIRQAYVLACFEDEMRRPIGDFDQIVEFGGGFGAFCLLAHRLGFRGRYVIVDNQPVRALQRWYLIGSGIPCAVDATLDQGDGVRTVPTTMLADVLAAPGFERTAFIANWSLSETALPLRNRVFDALRRAQVDAIWVTYQKSFEVNNPAYFASKLGDYIAVYEASIRPFHAEAPESDYYRGHGCLALRRIEGRSFPAAVLNLEAAPFETAEMRDLTMDELWADMRDAIATGRPYAALRLGDGEARIIGFPRYVTPPEVADIWQTWFGRPDFQQEDIARIRSDLREACLDADVVGVPRAEADIASEFGRVKVFLPREGFVRGATPLCHAGFHLGFHREGRYQSLLGGLEKIGVIGPRDLTDVLPRLYGIGAVVWLPTPPEMKYSDLPPAEKAEQIAGQRHLTTRYPELMQTIIPHMLRESPGMVVLVGAGILGKMYCRRIKQCGGIAIDVGSMMDVWAGLKTRDNQRFPGLRPVLG